MIAQGEAQRRVALGLTRHQLASPERATVTAAPSGAPKTDMHLPDKPLRLCAVRYVSIGHNGSDRPHPKEAVYRTVHLSTSGLVH